MGKKKKNSGWSRGEFGLSPQKPEIIIIKQKTPECVMEQVWRTEQRQKWSRASEGSFPQRGVAALGCSSSSSHGLPVAQHPVGSVEIHPSHLLGHLQERTGQERAQGWRWTLLVAPQKQQSPEGEQGEAEQHGRAAGQAGNQQELGLGMAQKSLGFSGMGGFQVRLEISRN